MAAISIINTRNFHYPIDFDAEHYHPDRIYSFDQLKQDATKVIADYFDNVVELCDADNLNEPNYVFDLTDALGCFLGEGEICSEISSTKKIAKPNDIIISRLRSYLLELCLIPQRGKDFNPLLSTEFVILRQRSNHGGAWLLPFLLSNHVQTILHWAQTGSNHPRFSTFALMNIPVSDAVLSLRDKLSKFVENAVRRFESSRLLYPEAEAELLERMGWEKLAAQPVELFYIEKYDGLQEHDRIDAEHFQPQYERLREHLQKVGAKHISEFCLPPKRGVQPEFVDSGEVLVIDSKAVRPQGVEPSNERTNMTSYNQESNTKGRVQKGDVLLNSTGRGTLGRAACYQIDKPALADNHVAIIRSDKHVCIPEYLSLFLNSPAGLAQSEMYQAGSSGQLELYPQHIMQFLIYLPKNKNGSIDLDWQKKLADKVISASKAKAEAQAKLEEAKMMVEKAISKR